MTSSEDSVLHTAPRVSFIVPSYNSRLTLIQTLRSLQAQTDRAIEIIVIDDGSSDGSAEEAQCVASSDSRVRVVRQRNAGVAETLNRGVALARSELLCFVGHDDLVAPDKVSSQAPIIENDPELGVVYSSVRLFYDDRLDMAVDYPVNTDGAALAETLIQGGVAFPPPAALVRRSVFVQVGGFDTSQFTEIEDTFLWARIALSGRRFQYSGGPPVLYRRTAGARSYDMVPIIRARLRLVRWLEARPECASQTRRRGLNSRRRYLALTLAHKLAERGEAWSARREALRAASLRPGHLLEVLRFLLLLRLPPPRLGGPD